MRNMFADTFFKAGQKNKKLAVIVADISPAGSMEKFHRKFPKRFINTGVAEQSMIGLAAGMAMQGMRPFAYTIATFSLYRPFEMVRDDLCYQELPVTIVGIGGGVTYSTLGGTHHAMEDVAIASSIPNMQVIAPCDPIETKDATNWCINKNRGPVYLRLGKAGEPTITNNAPDPFVMGKIRYLKKGKDVCLISYGPTVNIALGVAEKLQNKEKVSTSIISCHTLKPLDIQGIAKALKTHKRIIVIEEMVENGGLAQNIKKIAWEIQAKCSIKSFSLQDRFIHFFGDHQQLLSEHGLDVDKIFRSCLK